MIERLNRALEGRYRVERELGQGGMATVYLAEDVKHSRRVAVKVLKPELAAVVGAERFLAEIETTANLQHPHILPLYDSGEADSFLFYVMPYVEGESLRERLDREKQLPVEEAVAIAASVASALDFAHRHDVVHRDVKPANILMQDGQPVVADFGIALALSEAGGGRLTETGLSLGTPHYMSPEQASGDRTLDKRSDIYALACVTYEMLTGGPPFSGPTAQSVLMQILTAEAKPVTDVRKAVPEHVDMALAVGLQKLPADRFTSAEEFARALKQPGAVDLRRRTGETRAAARESGPAQKWRTALWPAAAAVLAVIAIWGWLDRPSLAQPVTRFRLVDARDGAIPRAGNDALAISPDGRTVAFLEWRDGQDLLTLRTLGSFQVREFALEAQTVQVDFSPDGRFLGLLDAASVRVMPVTGGTARVLWNLETTGSFGALTWEDDGYLYFNDGPRKLVRIHQDGGAPEVLFEGHPVGEISLLPGGDAAMVNIWSEASLLAQRTHFGVLDFESGRLDTLGVGQAARLAADNLLLWAREGAIFGQRFDPDRRRGTGSVVELVSGLSAAGSGGTAVSSPAFVVSESGNLVYVEVQPLENNLVAVSREGARTELDIQVRTDLGLRLSPDGTAITFEEEVQGVFDAWTADLDTGVRTRVTVNEGAYYPTWSPDGSRIAYYRERAESGYDLYWKNADGSGVVEPLLVGPGRMIEVSFLPDGERILVRQGDQALAEAADIYLYDIGDPESGRPVAAGPGRERAPMVSPDGRYMAYTSDEQGLGSEIFVRSIDNPDERWQVSNSGGIEPHWNRNGRELFYRSANQLLSVPVSLDGGFQIRGEPRVLFSTDGLSSNDNHISYALLPDDERFLFIRNPHVGNTIVVLNWLDEARRTLEAEQ